MPRLELIEAYKHLNDRLIQFSEKCKEVFLLILLREIGG